MQWMATPSTSAERRRNWIYRPASISERSPGVPWGLEGPISSLRRSTCCEDSREGSFRETEREILGRCAAPRECWNHPPRDMAKYEDTSTATEFYWPRTRMHFDCTTEDETVAFQSPCTSIRLLSKPADNAHRVLSQWSDCKKLLQTCLVFQ